MVIMIKPVGLFIHSSSLVDPGRGQPGTAPTGAPAGAVQQTRRDTFWTVDAME